MSHTIFGASPVRMAARCHVCRDAFHVDNVVVEHSGLVAQVGPASIFTGDAENGSIAMHPECATILAMRLLHDVMDIRRTPDGMRVVDSLRQIRDAYSMK